MSTNPFLLLSLVMSLLHLVATSTTQPAESLQATMAAKKWQRRVILIYARDANNADLMAQKRLLADQRVGMAERDFDQIIVLETALTAADRNYLRSGDRKLTSSADFMLYLIGKDGGVKQRFTRPVAPTTLFRLVDAMPMRQSEMRKNQQ